MQFSANFESGSGIAMQLLDSNTASNIDARCIKVAFINPVSELALAWEPKQIAFARKNIKKLKFQGALARLCGAI